MLHIFKRRGGIFLFLRQFCWLVCCLPCSPDTRLSSCLSCSSLVFIGMSYHAQQLWLNDWPFFLIIESSSPKPGKKIPAGAVSVFLGNRVYFLCVYCVHLWREKWLPVCVEGRWQMSCSRLSVIPLSRVSHWTWSRLVASKSLRISQPPAHSREEPTMGLQAQVPATPCLFFEFWAFKLRTSCFQNKHLAADHLPSALFKNCINSILSPFYKDWIGIRRYPGVLEGIVVFITRAY